MATLLESPEKPLSLAGVAEISQELARDISRLVLRTEGFTVEEYFALDGPYFVEYRDGSLQVLPMPNALHQALAFVLANMLVAWSKPDRLARTKLAPFRVRLSEQEYREPDVCFMTGANADRRRDEFWIGADLVVEIISESNRKHDCETKRREYALAQIPEYWIIDPVQRLVRVLSLQAGEYFALGDFGTQEVAASRLLPGFQVIVAELFAEAEAQA